MAAEGSGLAEDDDDDFSLKVRPPRVPDPAYKPFPSPYVNTCSFLHTNKLKVRLYSLAPAATPHLPSYHSQCPIAFPLPCNCPLCRCGKWTCNGSWSAGCKTGGGW